MSLIIHAPNVHQGGGEALLLSLLEAAGKQGSVWLILDQRLTVPENVLNGINQFRVTPSILGRLAGEWRLRSLAKDTDTVLCFGNLPPFFKVRGRVFVFLQNRYLVERVTLGGFSLAVRLRIVLERLWLSRGMKHADKVVVQTRSMQEAARRTLSRPVDVMPFWSDPSSYQRTGTDIERSRTATYDFLYVATGEPHKNHGNLIEAWKLLSSEGLYPSLCLTVPEEEYPGLIRFIDQARTEHQLRIHNLTAYSGSNMERVYEASRALVYPSLMESLGLPLIEARVAGLPIIAGELDYVRDIVDPDETFDPRSPVSLARAIKRFLGRNESVLPLLSPDEFLRHIMCVE